MSYIGWAGYDLTCCGEDATSSGIGGYGSIQLEFGWQLLGIPIDYGYWDYTTHEHVHDGTTRAKVKNYIIDQIDDLYATVSSGVETIVEVSNTYPGDLNAFLSYVVGSTPESSPNNWDLIYEDGIHREVAGFWIRIIGPNSPYIITWGSN